MKKWVLLLIVIPELCCAALPNHCRRFQLPGWWGSGEYLLMWRKKRFYPPLVTDGVLPDASILFGNERIYDSPESGGRADFGIWLVRCLGFGGGFFAVGKEEKDFKIQGNSDGDPVFARPFFNVVSGMQDALFISQPDNFIDGNLHIETTNTIWGGDLYSRYRLLASPCFKFDLLGGFRFLRIDDDLHSNTRTFDVADTQIVSILDRFNTRNDFYSGLVGFLTELRSSSWALYIIGKVGLGNMIKKVDITGQTTRVSRGGTTIVNSGFLAQLSNIGDHSRNQFEVIPEINAQIQLRICPHLWLTAGYQYIFWPKVSLAGDQVDLNIDETQVTSNPSFIPHDTSFWMQGFTAGVYFLY